MSASDHLRLFPHDTDRLTCWRAQQEEQQRQAEAERKAEAREQRRSLLRDEIEALRAEIAAVRDEAERRRIIGLEVTAEKVADLANKIFDHIDGRFRRVQIELCSLVEQRFAALEAKVNQARADVLADGKPRASGDFKFAAERKERDEPLDLPPLSKARGLN